MINAIRRFVARRGPVQHITGTNLVGAERVLRQDINSWNQDQIYELFQQSDIQWSFNPLTASHMGGAWERMIRSVRRALSSLTNDHVLTDEQLETFLLEAESVVNSCPLTHREYFNY